MLNFKEGACKPSENRRIHGPQLKKHLFRGNAIERYGSKKKPKEEAGPEREWI